MRSLWFPTILLLVIPFPGHADYEAGKAAYERGEYELAMRELLPAAKTGNPSAQFLVGYMYDEGQGVRRKTEEAIHWLQKAAEQNHARAELQIGLIYMFHGDLGPGIPPNFAEAARWFRRAAKHGDVDALLNLGFLYSGALFGSPRDEVEAYAWYKLATTQGQNEAGEFLESLEKRLTQAQLAAANERAVKLRAILRP